MKAAEIKFTFLFAALFASMLFQACTLDGLSEADRQQEVTENDLEAASQILAESLSDENEGVMASLNDAMATVSSSGYEKAPASSSEYPTVQSHDDDSKSGRGAERNFSHHYDPDTGTHTIIFTRIVHTGGYFKSVKDTLKYIFTDTDNQFVQSPRENRDHIETIDFKGSREGIIKTAVKESNFARKDNFFIDGVSEASEFLEVDGVHHGRGEMSVTRGERNMFLRSYTSRIELLDVNIDKNAIGENGNLEHGVTGTLVWEMTISRNSNGNSGTKHISGTVEMNGDGTALLRFERFARLFLINLDTGDVRDHSREFEGRVRQVMRNQGTFALANGRVIRITENTGIDAESDVHNLDEVAHALERGARVYAEGSGVVREGLFVASEIKFEVDENDARHFEGRVTDINLETRFITVGEDLTVRFDEGSVISGSSDLESLEAAREFLLAGEEIYITGYGPADPESGTFLIAIELKFEIEEEGQADFEGTVTSVNTADQLFTLHQERLFRIGENSIISTSGDLHSLAEVAEALELDQNILGFGKGVPDQQTEAELLVIEVTFLILD